MTPPDDLGAYEDQGFFCVLSQPTDSLPIEEFHHWYNTEHGPARLKLDNFTTGFRYKSRGLDPPVFLACYELKKISGLTEPQYTTLREKRSKRERHVLSRMKYMDRRIYTEFSTRGVDRSPAPILLVVRMYVKSERVNEVDRWYEEEHIEDLSKIPGWLRSRRFRMVLGDGVQNGVEELLAVHEFDRDNGLDGPEHMFAKSRPWRNRIVNEVIEGKDNMTFDFACILKAQDYENPKPLKGSNHVYTSGTER